MLLQASKSFENHVFKTRHFKVNVCKISDRSVSLLKQQSIVLYSRKMHNMPLHNANFFCIKAKAEWILFHEFIYHSTCYLFQKFNWLAKPEKNAVLKSRYLFKCVSSSVTLA